MMIIYFIGEFDFSTRLNIEQIKTRALTTFIKFDVIFCELLIYRTLACCAFLYGWGRGGGLKKGRGSNEGRPPD